MLEQTETDPTKAAIERWHRGRWSEDNEGTGDDDFKADATLLAQAYVDLVDGREAISQGYDMKPDRPCPSKCYWGSREHGINCPQGGCLGKKIEVKLP